MTELEHAIKHIKTRADAWAVKEVTEALQSISERLDKSLSQEPCDDAISRGAVIQALNKMDRYTATELTLCDTDKKFPANEVFIVDDVYEQITEHLPSVTQKSGKWIRVTDKAGHLVWECDKCSWQQRFNTNFCPDCGAKMESEE